MGGSAIGKLSVTIALSLCAIGLIAYIKNIYVTLVCAAVFIVVILLFNKDTLFYGMYESVPYIEKAPLVTTPKAPTTNDTGSYTPEVKGCSQDNYNLNSPNVFQIHTAQDLVNSKNRSGNNSRLTNSSGTKADYKNPEHVFLLMADIELGTAEAPYVINSQFYGWYFNATFDGNCYSITHFTIKDDNNGKDKIGFFSVVKAVAGTKAKVCNVTFRDFSFDVNTDKGSQLGIIAQATSSDDKAVTIENVTIIHNQISNINVSVNNYNKYALLCGYAQNVHFFDCTTILSGEFNLTNTNPKGCVFGGICGTFRNSNVYLCSSHYVGATVNITVSDVSKLKVGGLSGMCWRGTTNLFNNICVMKDSTINHQTSLFGYLVGRNSSATINMKHNTILDMSNNIFAEDKLMSNSPNLDEENKILHIGPNNEIVLNDQVYGMEVAVPNTNTSYTTKSQHTIKGGDLEKLTNLSHEECQQKCSENDECAGYTYRTRDDKCWLKKNVWKIEKKLDNLVSGVKDAPGEGTTETYWKKVYYVYYEGDLGNYRCGNYEMVNLWRHPDFYCSDTSGDTCNSNSYGICFYKTLQSGMEQFGSAVHMDCPDKDGRVVYKLNQNVSFNSSSFNPIQFPKFAVFDGGNNTVTVSGNNWKGLFSPVSETRFTVKNLNIKLNGTIKINGGGIITTTSSNVMSYSLTVTNCHSSGNKNIQKYAGGLLGTFAGRNNSEVVVTGCTNSCPIANSGGGIFGAGAGYKNGNIYVQYCSNTGVLKWNNCGGIMGQNMGKDGGNIFVKHCYNQGELKWNNSGGILGMRTSNYQPNQIIVANCYNSGNIVKGSAGSILGKNVKNVYLYTVILLQEIKCIL